MARPSQPTMLAVVVVAVGLLNGCGAGREESQSESGGAAARAREDRTPRMITGHGRVPGQNACRTATVKAGRRAGEIKVTLRCFGSRRGDVVFGVDHFATQNSTHRLGIRAQSKNLVVTEAGRAASMAGRCIQQHKRVLCSAPIDGPAAVSGVVEVSEDARCRESISVTGITVEPCGATLCTGVPVYDLLFSGRPRGCPA